MKRYVELRIPEHLRVGQTFYLFLSWLVEQKMEAYYKTENGGYLADTFNIPDDKLRDYYEEWLESLEENSVEVDGTTSSESSV